MILKEMKIGQVIRIALATCRTKIAISGLMTPELTQLGSPSIRCILEPQAI